MVILCRNLSVKQLNYSQEILCILFPQQMPIASSAKTRSKVCHDLKPNALDDFPKMDALYDKVKNHNKIQEWLEHRPETEL